MENRKKYHDLAARAARSTDEALQHDARRMLARLNAKPMSEIVAMIPGDSIPEKAAAIDVSRITLWYWLHGFNRPQNKAAAKIAKLTGLSINEIRGYP